MNDLKDNEPTNQAGAKGHDSKSLFRRKAEALIKARKEAEKAKKSRR